MQETGWVVFQSCPHKYWYDILMGFKTEFLIAYVVTLIFVIVLSIIRGVNEENKLQHDIKLKRLPIEQYEAETDRMDCTEDDEEVSDGK